jgi:high-affinity iron transporter
MPSRFALAMLLLAIAGPSASAPTADEVRTASRLLALLRGAASEYAEAFDSQGRLARPIELEEARLLLEEARDLALRAGLDPAELGRIETAIGERTEPESVLALAAAIGARVAAATGLSMQELPPAPPSIDRGAAVFAENCAGCHGVDGSGAGAESQRFGLAPADFTSEAFMRAETPEDFFNVVTLGRRRSGMPAWGETLSVQQRWDVVRYLWTFVQAPPVAAAGRAMLDARCATCADGLPEPPALARMSDDDLLTTLERRGAKTEMGEFDEPARRAVLAALRARAFDALVAPPDGVVAPPPATRPAAEAFVEVQGLLDAVLKASVQSGDATALATDAYMRFEPYEKRLGAVDPGLVRRLEEGFVQLRQAVRLVPPASGVSALVASLKADLDRAATALESAADAWVRFVQSAGIILREGFEVVLVVGALLAYVRRSGRPRMVRALYAGSALGVMGSIATAIVLVTLFRLTPWAGEALEGATMLLAAVVLFWVSYWLVSKAEADRWQRYIRGKVEGALTAGSGAALGAAAFLAVYREGFETILFYQALFAIAPPGDVMVPAGLATGLALLAVLYVGLARLGVRIPLGTFFMVTGGLLYVMAIVFAGRGVAELQEAGVLPMTPVSWAPRVETLGIFPTVESLVAQGIFLMLLVYAIAVTLVRRRALRTVAATPAPEPARKAAQG